MASAQREGRPRHRLTLLVLTAITLLTMDLRGFGPADTGQGLVRDILHPVTTLAATLFSPIGDAWNAVFDYDDLEAQNNALRAEIDALRGGAIGAEADSATLQRLLNALELPFVEDAETVTASVVRGSVGNFDGHVLTIDKGSRQGLESGMAVVTAAGLIGQVAEVDGATATVHLLSDSGLFVGVRLVSTDDVGLGHAVAGDAGFFLVDQGLNWPEGGDPTFLPEIGSAVVTSAASRYPADIPVGTVVAVGSGEDELTMQVRVELSNQIEDLHFVTILLAEGVDQIPLDPVVPSTSAPRPVDEVEEVDG